MEIVIELNKLWKEYKFFTNSILLFATSKLKETDLDFSRRSFLYWTGPQLVAQDPGVYFNLIGILHSHTTLLQSPSQASVPPPWWSAQHKKQTNKVFQP